jgi:hypothetical protein
MALRPGRPKVIAGKTEPQGGAMDKPEKRVDLNSELGMSRRDLLRRGAVVGGTLLWVAPAIQSLGPRALAQNVGSGSCSACYCWDGDKNDPNTPDGKLHEFGSEDFFLVPGQASEADCRDWCRHQNAYASSGGAFDHAYENFQFCKGTVCGTRVSKHEGADKHGAFCT